MKFEQEHEAIYNCPRSRIVLETDAVALPDILEAFEQFLRGCGFVFDGHLDIVSEEDCHETSCSDQG